MSKQQETPTDVKNWFFERAQKLWPFANGSISYRKSPCIRERCSICENGGHGSHLLQGKLKGKRFTVYVPAELAGEVAEAVERGRAMQELIMEAGERYTQALKRERQQKQERVKGRRR